MVESMYSDDVEFGSGPLPHTRYVGGGASDFQGYWNVSVSELRSADGALVRAGYGTVRDDDGGLARHAPQQLRHRRLPAGVHVLHHLVKDEVAARQAEPRARKVSEGERERKGEPAPLAARELRDGAHAFVPARPHQAHTLLDRATLGVKG